VPKVCVPVRRSKKLETAAKFAPADRDTIVDITRQALAQFVPEPQAGKRVEA
jgi:hypothetical protein